MEIFLFIVGIVVITVIANNTIIADDDVWVWVFLHKQMWGDDMYGNYFATHEEAVGFGNDCGPFHRPIDSRIASLSRVRLSSLPDKLKRNIPESIKKKIELKKLKGKTAKDFFKVLGDDDGYEKNINWKEYNKNTDPHICKFRSQESIKKITNEEAECFGIEHPRDCYTATGFFEIPKLYGARLVNIVILGEFDHEFEDAGHNKISMRNHANQPSKIT